MSLVAAGAVASWCRSTASSRSDARRSLILLRRDATGALGPNGGHLARGKSGGSSIVTESHLLPSTTLGTGLPNVPRAFSANSPDLERAGAGAAAMGGPRKPGSVRGYGAHV
jgi:hypothetical protein